MMKRARMIFLCILLLPVTVCFSQQESVTYAEKLGYPKGAKIVILHVDDAGMSFDSNRGTVQALTKGVANSCSVMMPCPWVPHFVHFLKEHPAVDAGLHLTLTSEWKEYRWGPLSGKSAVPGLVDKEGAMWPGVQEVVKSATAEEVYKEIKAQLERAREMGFEPTHLDSHMGTLFASPAFIQQYIRLGIENKIPVMMPAGHATLIGEQIKAGEQQLKEFRGIGTMLWNAGLPVLDDLHNYSYGWEPPKGTNAAGKGKANYKTALYINALKQLKPGITMVIMHCTAPTEVFKEISGSGLTRQADLEAMLDPAFKKALQKEGIILTTWRELKKRREGVK
jgi:chitin disaccharide deacetylase